MVLHNSGRKLLCVSSSCKFWLPKDANFNDQMSIYTMNDGEYHITYSYVDTSVFLPGSLAGGADTTGLPGEEASFGAVQFWTMTTEVYGRSKFFNISWMAFLLLFLQKMGLERRASYIRAILSFLRILILRLLSSRCFYSPRLVLLQRVKH